jgi:hypothetical protein
MTNMAIAAKATKPTMSFHMIDSFLRFADAAAILGDGSDPALTPNQQGLAPN